MQAKQHRSEAERLERLASALQEAERALRSNGRTTDGPGRPANDEDRKAIQDALAMMPAQFSLDQLKKAAKALKRDTFRRLFREAKEQGLVVEKIRAIGRRKGLYVKNEQAAHYPDARPA